MESTLQNIIDQEPLRWIFVGGKGGVGKTTTSCSIATQLAKHRKSVLLISTDPAHNISDAFAQKFSKSPELVNGYSNLYAMEVDATGAVADLIDSEAESGGGMAAQLKDIAFAIPGVDEAMSFAEVMKLVKSMEYSCVVFDTAPTGHTMRFLGFPAVLDKALTKFGSLGATLGPLISTLGGMGGAQDGPQENMFDRLEKMRQTVVEVNNQFQNFELTTFICVCIPEFLSLYETERMIQELVEMNIDTHNVVVNQLLYPAESSKCDHCLMRAKMQAKYLEQIEELYEDDFHVVKMPLLTGEIRGKESIEKFSEMLITPYVVKN